MLTSDTKVGSKTAGATRLTRRILTVDLLELLAPPHPEPIPLTITMPQDDIQYPAGFGLADVVAWGSTGLVVLDEVTQTVIKTPFDDSSTPQVERERQIYARFTELGGHQGILLYHSDVDGHGIRLQYAPKHDLQSFIKAQDVSLDVRLKWVTQVADALGFIHDAGIIHGDLTTANIFLDDGLDAKLADFAGSSIDSSRLLVAVTVSYENPGRVLSVQGDIFALGSLMYEVMTGERPYAALSEANVRARFMKHEFPDVTSLGRLGRLIRTCWEGSYDSSKTLTEDLKALSFSSENGLYQI